MNLNIVILAAGQGKRMHSKLPKTLQRLAGKPLLEHVVNTAQRLFPQKIHVIYGSHGGLVRKYFQNYNLNWIEQSEPLGTAHAVMQALPDIEQSAQVLILYGDVPLLSLETLKKLMEKMPADGLNLLSAKFNDPSGFGRIIRDSNNEVVEIIEHKDATPEQQEIQEINSGILVTTSSILRNYLPRINKNNAQGEYYLTDIVSILRQDGVAVNCLLTNNSQEVTGVNDKKQLADLERSYQNGLAKDLMAKGLTIIDPNRFDLRGELTVGKDVTVDVNVIFEGEVDIADDAYVGPNSYIKNTKIGKNVTIKANCVIEDAVIADSCTVGPFARIRPGTNLAKGSRIGNFVEVKNSEIGENTKINHLSYVGDSVVGKNVNVGAGTITCNYNGLVKHKTVIEEGVFVGSNASLVAPVTLSKNSVIGAGSVITSDTPAGKLTLSRAKQTTIDDWRREKK